MTEQEFQKAVLERFDRIEGRLDKLEGETDTALRVLRQIHPSTPHQLSP